MPVKISFHYRQQEHTQNNFPTNSGNYNFPYQQSYSLAKGFWSTPPKNLWVAVMTEIPLASKDGHRCYINNYQKLFFKIHICKEKKKKNAKCNALILIT